MRISENRGFALITVLVLAACAAAGVFGFVTVSRSQHRLALAKMRGRSADAVERAAALRIEAAVNRTIWQRRWFLSGPFAGPAVQTTAGGGLEPGRAQFRSWKDPFREPSRAYADETSSYEGSVGDLVTADQTYSVFTEATYEGVPLRRQREVEFSEGLLGPMNRDGTVLELGFASAETPTEEQALTRFRTLRENLRQARLAAAGADAARIEQARATRQAGVDQATLVIAGGRGRLPEPPPPEPTEEQKKEIEKTIEELKKPFFAVSAALQGTTTGAAEEEKLIDCPAMLGALAGAVNQYNRGKNEGLTELRPVFALVKEPVDSVHPAGTFALLMDQPRPAANPKVRDLYAGKVVCRVHGGMRSLESRDFLKECLSHQMRTIETFLVHQTTGLSVSSQDGTSWEGDIGVSMESFSHVLEHFDDPGQGGTFDGTFTEGTDGFTPLDSAHSGMAVASGAQLPSNFPMPEDRMALIGCAWHGSIALATMTTAAADTTVRRSSYPDTPEYEVDSYLASVNDALRKSPNSPCDRYQYAQRHLAPVCSGDREADETNQLAFAVMNILKFRAQALSSLTEDADLTATKAKITSLLKKLNRDPTKVDWSKTYRERTY